MEDKRESCCDRIIKASERLENHTEEIKSLKHLYKPVWGLCVLFIIGASLIVGLRQDVRGSETKLEIHSKDDNDDFRILYSRVANMEGRYEEIKALLKNIEKNQHEILEWQRQHQ